MKSLSNYISEKLIINKEFKKAIQSVDDDDFDWNKLKFEDIDKKYRDADPPRGIHSLYKKNKEPYQWVKWWMMLTQKSMSKTELFYKSGMIKNTNTKVQTHSSQFAILNRKNIIKYDSKTRKLYACPISKWQP